MLAVFPSNVSPWRQLLFVDIKLTLCRKNRKKHTMHYERVKGLGNCGHMSEFDLQLDPRPDERRVILTCRSPLSPPWYRSSSTPLTFRHLNAPSPLPPAPLPLHMPPLLPQRTPLHPCSCQRNRQLLTGQQVTALSVSFLSPCRSDRYWRFHWPSPPGPVPAMSDSRLPSTPGKPWRIS